VVTTRAASYSTPISRIEDQFSTVRERVTHVTVPWSLAEWKSIQRKASGAGWAKREMGRGAARRAASKTWWRKEETNLMV
jgi:hypothetical protein